MFDREALSLCLKLGPRRPHFPLFLATFACALALTIAAVGKADGQSAPSQSATRTAAAEAVSTPQPSTPTPGGTTDTFSGTGALSPRRLQVLVGRIALYPDDLLALVLTAATQPLEIVEADRFLEALETHPGAKPPTKWDPSVIALLNYPDVVKLMDGDLTWTEQLGALVIDNRAAVLDAIQTFRRQVYAAGNLRSNDKERVTVSSDDAAQGENPDETISISPADPQVIYVPIYEPDAVVAPAPNDGASAYDWSPAYPYYDDADATFVPDGWIAGFVGFGFGWHDRQIFRGDDHRDHHHGDDGVGRAPDGHVRLPPGAAMHGRAIWEPDHPAGRHAQPGFTGRESAEIGSALVAPRSWDAPLPSIARPLPQIGSGGARISVPTSVHVFRGTPAIHRSAAMSPHPLGFSGPRFAAPGFAAPHFAGAHFGAPMVAPRFAMVPSVVHGGLHR